MSNVLTGEFGWIAALLCFGVGCFLGGVSGALGRHKLDEWFTRHDERVRLERLLLRDLGRTQIPVAEIREVVKAPFWEAD